MNRTMKRLAHRVAHDVVEHAMEVERQDRFDALVTIADDGPAKPAGAAFALWEMFGGRSHYSASLCATKTEEHDAEVDRLLTVARKAAMDALRYEKAKV